MGRPVFAPDLTVRYASNRTGAVRATVVAGLKVSKRATVRNRAKRLVREALHRNLAAIHSGTDLVVYVKASAVGRSYRTMAQELGGAFTKARLLRGSWMDTEGKSEEGRV